MKLEREINDSIMQAMKSHDEVRRDTLRNVKKYIIEAKKAEANLEWLPDEEVLKIIQKLAKQGADSAIIYKEQGRADLYDYEIVQVEVLREFLPVQMSPEELASAVKKIIADSGATSMQDMGKVMGVASKQLANRADGRDISAKVRELLAAAQSAN